MCFKWWLIALTLSTTNLFIMGIYLELILKYFLMCPTLLNLLELDYEPRFHVLCSTQHAPVSLTSKSITVESPCPSLLDLWEFWYIPVTPVSEPQNPDTHYKQHSGRWVVQTGVNGICISNYMGMYGSIYQTMLHSYQVFHIYLIAYSNIWTFLYI